MPCKMPYKKASWGRQFARGRVSVVSSQVKTCACCIMMRLFFPHLFSSARVKLLSRTLRLRKPFTRSPSLIIPPLSVFCSAKFRLPVLAGHFQTKLDKLQFSPFIS